jgi:AmmeMemoRadiSam system protein A
VEYKNSGDSPYGDKRQVVGYWSLAVSGPPSAFDFTASEKKFLLKMARETIIHYLSEGKIPTPEIPEEMKNLSKHAGAFVTLKKQGALRGCIGRFSADVPLDQVVRQMAVASATQDSRFPKVKINEVGELEIEISVLSPMRKVSSPSEIIPGKHGIYMKKGYASGTFLPQVATEQDWTREEMLGHCARDKAGIGWDGWKTAELFVYEAVVFSEEEFTGHRD